jgi:hypothetical protein
MGTHHSGRAFEIMVGPDLPNLAQWDDDLTRTPPPLPRAFTCEEHEVVIRAYLERHYQPRRMAYRDGRP